MTVSNQVTTERRSESKKLLSDLVKNRAEMLSMYGSLVARRPFTGGDDIPQLLQEFCQTLVDYTASAHFRIYQYIDEKRERRRAVVELAGAIYPKILETTEAILDFNDKYDCEDHCEILGALESDLSLLGEHLADRIELEDKLITALSRPRS